MILGYNGNTIVLQHKGTGGVDEMVSHLVDDQMQYCLIRLPEIEKDVSKIDRKDGKQVQNLAISSHIQGNKRHLHCLARSFCETSRTRIEIISSRNCFGIPVLSLTILTPSRNIYNLIMLS